MFSIKHLFHSPKADGTDSTLVKPTAWNDAHDIQTDQSGIVLGRTAPGPGPIQELSISQMFPIGAITAFAGSAAPTGWLLCNGQSLIQADYPNLYAVIGQTYGAGVGPATFQLPDLRGVVLGGKSNMGGADRGNLPGGAVLGQYLGVSATTQFNLHSAGTNSIVFGNVGFVLTFGQISSASGTAGAGSGAGQLAGLTDGVNVQGYVPVGGNFGINVDGTVPALPVVQPTVIFNLIIKY